MKLQKKEKDCDYCNHLQKTRGCSLGFFGLLKRPALPLIVSIEPLANIVCYYTCDNGD